MNQYNLEGQVAAVTGGAQGIGRAIAERLLLSGASVCIWDIDRKRTGQTVEELNALGQGQVYGYSPDIRSYASMCACAKSTRSRFGRLDILINNAGIIGPEGPLWECDVQEWQRVIAVNLGGTFNCCKAVVPLMLENDYGRIINIASIAGKDGNPRLSGYSASKAGIIALTKSLGKELARTSIRVNAVAPAVAETELLGQMTEERAEWMRSLIPIERFIGVEEIASMVAWLSSEECSASTSAVFDISGGRATY